jgi:class 3 adenylate cyclase/TolB-like protein/Flp pilus assembly protein TadD
MAKKDPPHRLAAVLYADVAGYSRLTADDEAGTHRHLGERLDAFAAIVKGHRGRVMHYAGDALLAKFAAVVDALACAIEVQRDLAVRNSGLPGDRKVEFRIGLNLGDVIEDRGDIYGDGVNIAARLEAIAGPGEICVSESVRAAVGKKLQLQFEDLGEQALKNIERPVRAYRVIADASSVIARPAAGSRWSLTLRAPYVVAAAALLAAAAFIVVSYVPAANDAVALITNIPPAAAPRGVLPSSVAVLPFENLSPDADDAYFATALHAEVINQLVKMRSLNVIRAPSVVQYAGAGLRLPEIARELNVGTVLEATVAYAGERIALNATLTDAATGRHLWSERYDRSVEDAFAIQRDIATQIARELASELVPAQLASFARRPTDSPEAYALYLQAISLEGRENSSDRAIELLSRAIAIDDAYADAYAHRARMYAAGLVDNTIGDSASSAAEAELERRARADAERALELDEASAEALSTLAALDVYSWNWTSARARLARLMRAGDPGASASPIYVFFVGEEDAAIRLARRGVELRPNEWVAHRDLAWVLRLARDTDGARGALQRAVELSPDRSIPHRWMAYLAAARGDTAEALEEIRIAERLLGDDRPRLALAEIAKVYGQLGRVDDARRLFDEIMGAGDPGELGAGTLAAAYLAIGDHERAIESLRAAAAKVRDHEPDAGFWSLMHLVHDVTGHPALARSEFVEALSLIRGD